AISQLRAARQETPLADHTRLPHNSARHDVTEVPDFGSSPQQRARFAYGRWVNHARLPTPRIGFREANAPEPVSPSPTESCRSTLTRRSSINTNAQRSRITAEEIAQTSKTWPRF